MEREEIRILWQSMEIQLNEMQRRQYAATLAKHMDTEARQLFMKKPAYH